MHQLLYGTISSPIGNITIIANDHALIYVDFADNPERRQRLLAQRYGEYQLVESADPYGFSRALNRYFAGDLAAVDDLPVSLAGTDFQQRVWLALRTIPAGQTQTYGGLAQQLGMSVGAARAIGITNSLNPIGIVLPCHRVIGANNALTGYAGGIERKRWLLQHEGVAFLNTSSQTMLELDV